MRKSISFSAQRTAPTAVTWWFAPIGGFVAALLLWGLGAPMTFSHWLPDNPIVRGAFDVLVCVVVAYLLIFIFWLICFPIHRKFEAKGGIRAALRQQFGVHMWPIVLMAAGLFSFVTLSGAGLVWLVVQTAKGEPKHTASNSEAATPTQTAFIPDHQTQVRMQIFNRTAALGTKDKEELSATFRVMTQTLNETDEMIEGLRRIGQAIKGDGPPNGNLSQNLPNYMNDLKPLREKASALRVKLQNYFHDQYFDQQINYIVGNDVSKAAIAQAESESLRNFLRALASVKNQDAEISNLSEPALTKFQDGVNQFYSWTSGCRARLAEIKQLVT